MTLCFEVLVCQCVERNISEHTVIHTFQLLPKQDCCNAIFFISHGSCEIIFTSPESVNPWCRPAHNISELVIMNSDVMQLLTQLNEFMYFIYVLKRQYQSFISGNSSVCWHFFSNMKRKML